MYNGICLWFENIQWYFNVYWQGCCWVWVDLIKDVKVEIDVKNNFLIFFFEIICCRGDDLDMIWWMYVVDIKVMCDVGVFDEFIMVVVFGV